MTGEPGPAAVRSEERAKRAHDHLRLMHTVHGDEAFGRWVAISLANGHCDTHLYSSKNEAVRFQLHETQCAYLYLCAIPLLSELRYFLDACEQLYDAGLSMADPDTYVNPEAML